MEPEDEVPEDDEEVNEEPVVAIPKKKAPVKKVTPRVATAWVIKLNISYQKLTCLSIIDPKFI